MQLGGPQQKDCGCVDNQNTRKEFSARKNNKLICHAPWQRLVLDSEGQVRPFVFCMDKWIGNSDQSSLQDIWNGPLMQEYRRRIIDGDYKGLCQPECISGQVADKIRDIK
jgi:MoaA/NifB/PqqE/SkfB family radical SAM enzyme